MINVSRKGVIIAIIMIVGIFSLSGLIAWYAISIPDVKINDAQNLIPDSNFETRKQRVLDSLEQIQKDFTVEFDKDLTSKQENDAIYHTYKIIHKTDGRIGDLTFYYGKSDIFHPSKFDKIFQTNMFMSNEYGVKPTTYSLPIIKDVLFILIPVWSYDGIEENSSDWLDNVIKNAPIDENEEQSGTISSDKQEIHFDYREKESGYYRLLITDKID